LNGGGGGVKRIEILHSLSPVEKYDVAAKVCFVLDVRKDKMSLELAGKVVAIWSSPGAGLLISAKQRFSILDA
jgi:predicted benzoate:H+ symporter BenE